MPTNKHRVEIYYGPEPTFNELLDTGRIDENGIYFITDPSSNKIYVGDKLFQGGGSGGDEEESTTEFSVSNVVFHHLGPLICNQEYDFDLTLSDEPNPNDVSCTISGIYINGLRSVSELDVSVEPRFEGDIRILTLSVTPHHDYLDPETELTIDISCFESEGTPPAADTITIEIDDRNIMIET